MRRTNLLIRQRLCRLRAVCLLQIPFKMTAIQIPTRTKWLKNKVSMYNQKVVLKEDKTKRERLQSTEERLANTNRMHPPCILELLDMSKTTHHKVSRQVKLELKDSEYFYVGGPEDACCKVAPGMSSTFTVFFTPQENKDYHHNLVCVTERERFEVPVRAIGPRAILDFQDEFYLPVCAVKAFTQKTHLVRNIGNSIAIFKLHTKKPFSVTPSSGTLDVGESLQVTVDFHPMTVGDHTQDLLLHYHTGEDVYMSLYGTCEELNIHLEPDSLLLKKTYISLASTRTVSLTNTSNIPLQYCWSAWSSQEDKDQSLLRESSVLQQKEKELLLIKRDSDPTAIQHMSLLSRALQESRDHTARDHLLAAPQSCITVEPVEGEIWPNVTVQFNIVFKPEEAMLYEQTLYCDVTGRESWLPLTIKGEGIGPKLQLNYNLMDMKNVFVGDKDCYEVLLTNSGLIDAPFKLSSPDTAFGRCFSFHPEEGVVPSGACQIVEVTFHSHVLGTFSEDLLLTVIGQPEPLILTFRGCVIGPTFHFNVSELNFGDIAFGFPLTLPCTLFNTSFVPMKFALRVVGDGLGSPSITSATQVSELSRNNWQSTTAKDLYMRPVEFTVSPAEGSVRAMSDITIQVTLCSNTVKGYRLALVVDVDGVGNDIKTLPIIARCVVPEIVVETPMLDFERCFLNYPYHQQVRLTNPSPLPACYGVLDQEYEESPSLLFGSSVPRGVILPYSSEELPLFLLAKAVGRLRQSLWIAVFGSIHPPLEVVMSCIGQGPVVHIQSPQVEFGRIPVLMDITKTLHLSNHSPIPAIFTACMVNIHSNTDSTLNTHTLLKVLGDSKGRSFYRVEPSEGEVPPESQLELKVVAHLKDTLLFQDRLEVSIQDSQTYTVHLSATGTGTTIVSDKPFAPSLDLGAHFSNGPCQYHFKLTNHGQRVHRIYWGTEGFLPYTRTSKDDNFSGRTILPTISSPRKKGVLGIGSLLSSCRKKPVFSLTPSRVELFPGCSVDMVLTGMSDSSKVVRERLVCRGIVGHQGCSEQIMSVDVTCRFVAPVLNISSKHLNFYIEKSIILGDERQTELWICFNPSYIQDRVSRIVDEVLEVHYQGHPQQDIVKLHAEVYFPNLHFSSTVVDFGCVLNSTENHREITITNCSPLPVSYHWDFLEDRKHFSIRATERLEEDKQKLKSEEGSDFGRIPSAFSFHLNTEPGPLRVEEVFDILPIHGHLQPEDQQVVTFSFFGHANISREVVAQCHVEEGPTYEIKLRGEASAISYSLDSTHVNFGLQLFDHVGEAEVTLRNTGRVGFKFSIIHHRRDKDIEGNQDAKGQKKAPGKESQHLDAREHIDTKQENDEQEVIPGHPTVIPTTGYIDAGAEQCLRVLYLPAEERYSEVMQQAKAAVEADLVREELMNGITSGGQATTESSCCTNTYVQLLHMEIERILVKANALAVTGSLLELRDSEGSSKKWHKLSKFMLPEYILDFGYVIPGKVLSHTVNTTNCGAVPVSFHANRKALAGTGFSAEFERVKNLPCGETQTFTVKFDPQGAKEQMEAISVLMPIQVTGGPMVQVRLCAVVNMPAITVSTDILLFDTVQCGMCQVDKFPPHYRRKKLLKEQRPPPAVFEIIPSSGILSPSKRVNIQIKFSPTEGHVYKRQLVVHVAESTQQVFITAQGQGEEPQLEFSPSVLELGPSLPGSTEIEAEVIVRNPCSFPIEFYSLDFDKNYLEEEKILRLMQEYDENNILLLPPRAPGESLPTELLDYYKEYCSQMEDYANEVGVNKEEGEKDDTQEGKTTSDLQHSKKGEIHSIKLLELFTTEMIRKGSSERLGQLELTPVLKAIARHIGVDLSPECLAARNRRGIAIIVYGAPQTGKSSTAAALAQYYGGACLSVDTLVTDVLLNGNSPVSLKARELYDHTVAEYTEKKVQEAAQALENTTELEPGTDSKASDPVPNSDPVPIDGEVLTKPSDDSCNRNNSKAPNELHSALIGPCLLSDCYCGVVIDGLESVYTQSVTSTLQVVLKAFNNRKHIYVVHLADSSASQTQTDEAPQKEEADIEEQWLQEMDEEVYESLPEEQKERIIQRHRENLRQQKLSELKRISKEQEEKKQQEEMKNLRQDELKKKNKKSGKKDTKEVSRKKSLLDGKQVFSADPANGQTTSSCNNSKESLMDAREQNNLNGGHHSKETEDSQKQTDNSKVLHSVSPQPRDKSERKKSIIALDEHADISQKRTEEGKGLYPESPIPAAKLEGEMSSVDELGSSFIAYEQIQEQVDHILRHWDRAQGLLLVPLPTEKSPVVLDDAPTSEEKLSPIGRKSKKAISKTLSPTPSQMASSEDTDKEEERASTQDIPHIVVKVTMKDYPSATELLKGNVLPEVDKVLDDLGLGPSGPPIPPPMTFSMVPFPQNRKQSSSQLTCDCFTFLIMEESEATASRGQSKCNIKESAVTKDKEKKARENQKSKSRTSMKPKAKGFDRGQSPSYISTISDITEQDQNQVDLELKRNQRQEKPHTDTQELTVWAYPTKPGQIRDSMVCFIKDNPEHFIINFSCCGVRPELELESKHLQFDRVLLHRWENRSVTLHNKTGLPVSWRLQGLEEFGDEFSVPQDQGIISPNSFFSLSLHFRARKPLKIKKTLRLEVSDVEKILGIVYTENIQVTAEAYDIALDITPDGCLDFGTIKVFEESKLSLRMKNQGKYEIAYKFSFEQTDPTQPKLDSIFTVYPHRGSLMPHEKPTTVQLICRPNTEVLIRKEPILSCQVIEPSLGNGGEIIAIIAIKLSVQSVFLRYKITPACDINFGPLVFGSKKSQSFTIENNGIFETRFTVCMITDHTLQGKQGCPSKKTPRENHSAMPTGISSKLKRESIHKEAPVIQNRLTMGVFSVSPSTGSLQPGSQQVVTVDCVAEQLGNWNHGLLIDISDRDPSDHPEGIPYRLLAEVCKPGIILDMASIFEEHYLCHSSRQLSSPQFSSAEGIYLLDENKFIFNKVLVGQTAQARFKLTNNNKVPCVLNLALKYVGSKVSRNMEGFDLSAATLTIPSQSHSYAVATFTPQTMQLYSAVFEATMDGTNRMTPTFKTKVLEFELMGEGSLPSVSVVRPALRDSRGSPVLQFRPVLVGRRHTLALVLLNDGSFPAQVQIDMLDKNGVFTLKAAPGNTCSTIYSKELDGTTDSEHQLVHRAILRLNSNEQVAFEVSFCSDKPRSVKATMSLQVQDNQYCNTAIQVNGEAYQEIVSLDNINTSSQEVTRVDEERGYYEVLDFGDCHVDCPYQRSFTMTNHSSSQVVRFEWPPAGPHLSFSPQVGHLHAGCSKEVAVTFSSNRPVTLSSQPMRCKMYQVEFQHPVDQVADWDDRPRTVQWQRASHQGLATQPLPPLKNKFIKTDPEPSYSAVEGSQWELELRVSAICDYVKFSCNSDTIHFKDTMLYQSRIHHQSEGMLSRERPPSTLAGGMSGIGNPKLLPFSVEPNIGAIKPGSTQKFSVHFSPLEVAQFQGRLFCSMSNLEDGVQAPCITVCGRSLLPHCHFDLEESDYISGDCRKHKFRSHFDPEIKVIEFNAVGLSAPIRRCFTVLNPTTKPYSFMWKCKDKGGSHFLCLTQCGTILPGKKVEVGISEQSTFNFVVSCLARFNLVVNFEITGPSELLQHLEAKPQNAVIEVGKQLQSSLFFHPQSICKLQDVRLSIKVKHGPTFTFAIKGRAVAPSLEFSFTKFNFGKCFLHCPGMVPPSKTLVISNKDERDISIQCQFENTSYLEMDFHPDILSPGAVMEVPLTFYPREADRYYEKITFIFNSCVRKHVDILGRGIEMNLTVENPKHKKIKLGSVMLGQKVKKQVVIVNRSALDVSFTLVLNTNTPLDPKDLKISPAGNLCLKANGGSSNVEVQFSPCQYIPPFKAELQAEFAGLLHHLLTIQGCCQGVEVLLDQDHLAFGAVVQRCQAKKRIVMMNTGDLGARFQWKTKNFPPELTISPAKGYIAAGMEVTFEVTFAPEELSNDIRYENLACFVDGSSSSVSLTVTGSCIVASTGKEVYDGMISFSVLSFHVLMEIVKPDKPDSTVSLKGLEYIDVPGLAKRDYKVSFFTYREGQYNTKVTFNNERTGEYLFFLINFKATLPGVLSIIELVTTVRRTVSATVQVENPLTTSICLTTECKCVDISAPHQHTVPGQSKCSLSFEYQPQRAGESTARLTLSSSELGYFYYDLLLKALPPPPEKTVHFSASLGSSHSVLVKFISYSHSKAEYSCKSDSPAFTVEKSVSASPGFHAGAEASVEVCFEPHQLGEVRGQLNLSSAIGGEFIFPLNGICLPPKAQGPFGVRAGRNINIPFKNVFLQTMTFFFQVDNPCFTIKGVDTMLSKKTQNIMVSFEAPADGSAGPWFGKLTISTQSSEGHSKPYSWVCYLKGYRPESP
ncbi:Hydrocephalus-inducing protein Hy-3 [Channa argus]|uniref:Hydrocephalus-inducing protein Hy-3 n=1 Tax=Channa argus TaxID=215402 RepID=A0A6G1PGK4_CHAAH|nr:Hydrocephalus-inducing protein Hy-3 [Channa argus]